MPLRSGGHPRRELSVAYVLQSRGQVLLQCVASHTLGDQLPEIFWQPALWDVVVERRSERRGSGASSSREWPMRIRASVLLLAMESCMGISLSPPSFSCKL